MNFLAAWELTEGRFPPLGILTGLTIIIIPAVSISSCEKDVPALTSSNLLTYKIIKFLTHLKKKKKKILL